MSMATSDDKVRVLIIDDSAIVREVLRRQLSLDPCLDVVGTAKDPYDARNKILELEPDVVTLDIGMPRMDGITFLRKLMHYHPLPVIIVSALTEQGGQLAMDAMRAGAVDVISKSGRNFKLADLAVELIEKIKGAAQVNFKGDVGARQLSTNRLQPLRRRTRNIIAIGTSTGGTEALRYVLPALPENCPGIVIVQHMPEQFTRCFAEDLNRECAISVKEAENGDPVTQGHALVAPGNKHLLLRKRGEEYYAVVKTGPRVNRHRPSADVLFKSVASCAGSDAVGVIMTGMGNDGAAGLLCMREAGARTIGQDEESCIVYGMPKVAAKLGGVERVVSLEQIPAVMMESTEPASQTSNLRS